MEFSVSETKKKKSQKNNNNHDNVIFRQPLKAEGHEVLYLSKSSIVQILFGAKGSVWIVYDRADEMGDHCRRILNFPAFNVPRLIH